MPNNNKDFVLKKALIKAAKKFKGTCSGKIHNGWHNKSMGQSILQNDNQLRWLQVSYFTTLDLAKFHINRIEQANSLKNILKPDLYQSFVWQEKDLYLVGLLMTHIQEPLFTENPYLAHEIELPSHWLLSLKNQLDSLSLHSTNFTSCRQDLITRRIEERYGIFDSRIQRWGTIHGDLNWKNITSQRPYLLDWEGWGTGPLRLDLCFLYCFSLLAPKTANEIKLFFSDFFQSTHGNICLLFVCSELLRMTEIYGDHPELYNPLSLLADGIVKNETNN